MVSVASSFAGADPSGHSVTVKGISSLRIGYVTKAQVKSLPKNLRLTFVTLAGYTQANRPHIDGVKSTSSAFHPVNSSDLKMRVSAERERGRERGAFARRITWQTVSG